MGYYIQTPGTNLEKAKYLVDTMGGKLISKPRNFGEIPEDKALIVVVSNGLFEAAGLAFSDAEFKAFTLPDDYREKKFVLLDKKLAYQESGYEK